MENQLERPNYYGILPADVRYADISASSKLLYVEITALTNKTGVCWASNKYFSQLYGVSVNTVSRWVAELETAGFISTKIIKEAGNKRHINITDVPIHKNVDSYPQKCGDTNNKTNKSSIVDLKGSELLSLVNKITGRDFRTLPDRGVKKTLDAFTLEEIEAALRALVADEWHRDKLKSFKIDYFIRATTIDKFLGQAKPLPSSDEAAARRQREVEDDEEADAFRNDRREEYYEARDSGKIDEYRKKYGLTYHVD